MTNSPADFIADKGGAHALARALGLKPVTVRMWKFRNHIPRTAWPEIIEAFPKVTLDELKRMEEA